MGDSVTVTLDRITHRFGDGAAAVRDVSLAIGGGEFVSLVGPSGCGKSTLLRLMAGLMTPSEGSVDRQPATSERGSTAFVFQDPTLLPWRTVAENIALPLELGGTAPRTARERARDRLAQVGLTAADAAKFPRELSGGMRMRASLARALVTEPQLLLLDEPFAALDDLLRGQLNEELLRLWQAQAWTCAFVTHNVAEAVYLSQRVIVMSPRPGTIVADVPISLGYPRDPSIRGAGEFARLVGEVSGHLRKAAA